MRLSLSFFDLLKEAIRIVLSSRLLLIGYGSLFGILAWGTFVLGNRLAALLPQDPAAYPAALFRADTIQPTLILLLGAIVWLTLVRTAARGPFFVTTETQLLRRADPSPSVSLTLRSRRLLRAFFVAWCYEVLYWTTLLTFACILFFPAIVAKYQNPSALFMLVQLASILWLILSVLFFFLKEFALLYQLLAHMRFRLALELGLQLFQRHAILSLLFGLFLIALSVLFTFVLNLAIIAYGHMEPVWLQPLFITITTVIILGLGSVVQETLRLLFFHALAATPKKNLPKAVELVEEKNPSSAPTV